MPPTLTQTTRSVTPTGRTSAARKPITAFEFRQLIEKHGLIGGCRQVDSSIVNEKQATLYVYKYVMRLLNADQYLAAALVLWGDTIFNPRPACVQRVWRALRENCKTLIQGCGSVGKSYVSAAFFLLDWWTDPKFTSVKVISTTKGHAKGNTFSTMVRLHDNAIIKMPGIVTSDYIGLDPKERKSGIAVLAIPPGDDGKGRLQGFHPDPRPQSHPRFGTSSRIRCFLDEAEEIPLGVWSGIDNMLLSADGVEKIKVAGAYNPKDPTSMTAQNAEPDGGWDSFDIEKGVRGKNEWKSKNNWHVLRLDGKQTENVRQKITVYPGFLTWQGYRELETKDGGNSLSYYTFARGAYPPEGAVGVIVSTKVLQESRGEYIFIGRPVKAAGVDVAVDGRDNAVITVGATGMASGFRRKDGTLVKFREPRQVLQAEQQFELKKGSTKIVGDAIMQTCIKLGIMPENCTIDATGNGAAVHAYLVAIWGNVQGVDFNKAATTKKILVEELRTPEELYEMLVTEVWFAVAKWMEFGYFSIAPGVRQHPLESELTSRRCIMGAGKLLRVEKKDDYKKRIGKSPDYADSLTLLLHGVRMRESMMGSMQGKEKPQPTQLGRITHDIGEPEWIEDAGPV